MVRLRERAEQIAELEGKQGHLEKSWSHVGGYAGFKVGGLHYAEGVQGGIIVLAGSTSNQYYSRVIDICRASRIDLAVTITLSRTMALAKMCYAADRQNNQTKRTLLQGSDGGDTLYIGSRTSPQFGRLYDKGVQSATDAAGMMWRYEVEYKQAAARAIQKLLRTWPGAIPGLIVSIVWRWYDDREVPPVFLSNEKPPSLLIEQKEPDSTSALWWLRTAVRPCVGRLARSGIDIHEVYDALGLAYVIEPVGHWHPDQSVVS